MKLMIIQVKISYVCVCETKCLTSHVKLAPVLSLYVTVPHVRMNTVISYNCTIRSLSLTSLLGVWA